jgi:hypothetical protein
VKPDVDRFLEVAAAHLMMKTAPALSTGYEQATAMGMGALLLAVREENERAAARRVEENASLRALFDEAESVVQDESLRTRLAGAASGREESLLLSQLEVANGVLRALLIELPAHVEAIDGSDARGLVAAIWRELAASTERRKLSLGPF